MQLLVLCAAGFTATVDACAQDGGQLWFLSLLGSQQAVRALWARLVKGETAYLGEDELTGGSPCWLAREAWGTWRFHGCLWGGKMSSVSFLTYAATHSYS